MRLAAFLESWSTVLWILLWVMNVTLRDIDVPCNPFAPFWDKSGASRDYHGYMPTEEKSFDAHLGSLISSLARLKGGRAFLADLLGLEVKTISRRAAGTGQYSVRELNIVAYALGMTADEILSLALRNYSGGTAEDGVRKLVEEGKAVSEPPVSLDKRRESKKTARHDGDAAREGTPNAANDDEEMGFDEPGDA